MRLEETVHPVLFSPRPWNPDILLNEFPLLIHLGTKTFFTQENICKSSSKPRDPSQHLKVDQRQGFLAKAEKLRDGFGETSAAINFPDCSGGGRGATVWMCPSPPGQARRCSQVLVTHGSLCRPDGRRPASPGASRRAASAPSLCQSHPESQRKPAILLVFASRVADGLARQYPGQTPRHREKSPQK